VPLELPEMDTDAAVALAGDLALRVDLQSTRLVVSPGLPAEEAGIRDGDRVLAIDGAPIEAYEQLMERSREAARSGQVLHFTLMRPGEADPQPFEVEVAPAPWHPLTYGVQPRVATYVYRVDHPFEAVQVGMVSCWKFLQDTWLTLKGMVVRKVSPKNVGGPIAIGVYAYSWAASGWTRLFFFLCMLSINLAFINVLPIPLLDGGHLMFLIIEKIKGSPVSYRVMSYSQVIGLVLIVSLFVFVIYNDVQHHILE
jgi:regulator of sigma E protease